ncbi:hypothetical protein CEP53_001471 [Fusarium sp. AF-6]|nr:hypothetical protein CEP53_001471 [Fusarium sp. AF-6]
MAVKVARGLGLTSKLLVLGLDETGGFEVFKLAVSLRLVDAVSGRTALLGMILR